MAAVTPDFEAFEARLASAGGATVIPVVRELLADTLTPVAAYATVGTGAGSFLLESVVGGNQRARYSFVGFDPELSVRGGGGRFERIAPDGAVDAADCDDPWEPLRALLALYRPAEVEGLPRFWGGAVGYVSYDAVREFEPTVSAAPAPADAEYDFALCLGSTLLIFDNVLQTLRIVVPAHVPPGADARAVYDDAVRRIEEATAKLEAPAGLRPMPPPGPDVEVEVPPSSFDHDSFCAAVERCQEYIRAGDIFQVVLSQRFRVPARDTDLFDVYRCMRAINPSPYMYFLRFEHTAIAGASPETLVRLEGETAEVRPIAGTRKRGRNAAEDAEIERDLFADPKEVAEHVMLVDLGRNDIGRISRPGTVELTERMVAEYYSHVMHITSNVSGKLAPGRDALDVLRATFPAGTLSGAPKVRAMQIIEELEPETRGVYGGAVGYIGFDGSMDVAIAIRTIVQRGDEFWVQAGAGIVEASRAEMEYDETVNKARAALLSIAAARKGR